MDWTQTLLVRNFDRESLDKATAAPTVTIAARSARRCRLLPCARDGPGTTMTDSARVRRAESGIVGGWVTHAIDGEFTLIGHLRGVVTRVENGEIVTRMRDADGDSGDDDVEVVFAEGDLSHTDGPAVIGGVVHWIVGYVDAAHGQRSRVSTLCFAREYTSPRGVYSREEGQ